MAYVNLYLVRHGDKQPKKNYSDTEGRRLKLTTLGLAQAQSTGEYLAQTQIYFERLISSPYIRCRQTATAIASCLHKTVEYNPQLTERILHPLDLPAAQACENIARAHYEPTWAPAGGESLYRISERFTQGLQGYLHGGSCPTPKNLLVVTHGRILQTWLAFTFEKPELLSEELLVDTCSVTTVRLNNRSLELLNFNDTRHLAGLKSQSEHITD